MSKGCVNKLKSSSLELHDYLENKAGVYSDATKEAWKKAASELQSRTLDNLNNIYADLGVAGYEKIIPKSSASVSMPVDNAPDISVSEMIDKPIVYNGNRGRLYQDGQSVVFKVEGQNKEYELGNIDEIKDSPIADFGLSNEQSVVTANGNGNIIVRDHEYTNNYSDPFAAINTDEAGNVVSVNLETADGKKRTFRGNIAEDVAYQIHLKEITKDNETTASFEQHLNTDPVAQKEMDNGIIPEVAPENTTQSNEPVQREKIEPVVSPKKTTSDEASNNVKAESGNKQSQQQAGEKSKDTEPTAEEGEGAKDPPKKPPVDDNGTGQRNDGNFFDGKQLSLSGEKAQYLSKPTIEVSGKEITQPFEYDKIELDALVEDGKRWVAEAKEKFNGSPVEYAVKMYSAIKNLKNMPVKAVSMVSLLNAIDTDLKYRDLSFGERDQLKGVRRGLELEIAKNAREGSLVLNAQRLIHKLYKGEYKFTEATASIVTAPVQKQADTVIEKVREETTDVSEVVREVKRKEAAKEDTEPKEAPKPKPKKQKKEKKTTFFQKRLDSASQDAIDKLKKDISDIANKIDCGKKK